MDTALSASGRHPKLKLPLSRPIRTGRGGQGCLNAGDLSPGCRHQLVSTPTTCQRLRAALKKPVRSRQRNATQKQVDAMRGASRKVPSAGEASAPRIVAVTWQRCRKMARCRHDLSPGWTAAGRCWRHSLPSQSRATVSEVYSLAAVIKPRNNPVLLGRRARQCLAPAIAASYELSVFSSYPDIEYARDVAARR